MPKREDTVRECALTRTDKPIADLLRFVVGPEDAIYVDIDARAEGRGVWITLAQAAVEEAVRKKVFAKSLKMPVKVPDDLAEQARERLEQRLLAALSMAKKAGQLVTGSFKVRASLEGTDALALLTATDAAPDGRNKMVGVLRALNASRKDGAEVPHLELLSSTQLGLALGLENVIHAALTTGAAAKSALERANRLSRYIATQQNETLG